MSDSELLTELYDNQVSERIVLGMAGLAIFEFVTTLDQEVSSIWKRKLSGASLLLFGVRYTMISSAILIFFSLVDPSNSKGCLVFVLFQVIFDLLGFVFTALLSALRVYALCDRSVALFAVVFILQLSPVAVNLYSNVESTYEMDPIDGCHSKYTFDPKLMEIFPYVARIPVIIGDLVVIIVTWLKSYEQLRAQQGLNIHLSYSTVLFRDGTAYFLLLLIFNILEVCPLTDSQGGYVLGAVIASFPVILLHRFMMNLRQLSDSETRSEGRLRTIPTSIVFGISVDVAGNMGEPLDHGWGTRPDDDVKDLEVSPVSEEFELTGR